jgi:mannose-6-phosphate isomerase-like protein (cupin superfamily)
VACDDEAFPPGENQSTDIPLGSWHRMGHPGQLPLEVRSGSYPGEDDIYGRA